MEIESEKGARFSINPASATELGRTTGLCSSDRSVSRCHISLHLPNSDVEKTDPGGSSRVCFEVVGKNPILVVRGGSGEKRVFRHSERGELGVGDRFSLSLKNPRFCNVKEAGDGVDKSVLDAVRRREERTLQRRRGEEEEERSTGRRGEEEEERSAGKGKGAAGISEEEDEGLAAELDLDELERLDISKIDPVKEFGFFARGHEFDQYPRQRIRAMKDWDWFLDEPRESSDEEEDFAGKKSRQSKGKGRKRTKTEDNDDEEWTGESENEEEFIAKVQNSKRPKYSTRSKDGRDQQKAASSRNVGVDEENDGDETLGGFIVDDVQEVEEYEDEEEEEFDDDDEEEDD